MKKAISLLLCLILVCSTVFSMNVRARNDFYTKEAENLIDYLQTDYPELLQKNSNYEYVQFVNNFNGSWISLYFLHMADFFAQTGTTPDEEKYKEVLLNIIETHDLSKSGDIASQKKMDNLKTFEDYGKDTVKIGAQAVSVMSGISSSTSNLEENISLAVDGLSVLIDTTENWIDALSKLETVVQNYSYYSDFLTTIENNANGELKKAASSLKETLDAGMKIKLETYTQITTENFEEWGEEFFSDVFFETCKLTEEYETDDTMKWFVDSGQNVVEKLESLNGSWELGKMIGILVGNLAVGGENLADRLLETMAVKEIGEILSENLQDILVEDFQDIVGTEKETNFVQKYVTISQFLVDCRVRGEYCWYSIISNDAGLLSWFNKKTGESAEEIYNSLVEIMQETQNELKKIIQVSENDKIETDVNYEYANGEFLSDFHLEIVDGLKMAYLSFWVNYGASASVEDFYFLWDDNQLQYQLKGNRSGKNFDVVIEPKDENTIKIEVTCQEKYFNWLSGEEDWVWSSVEYRRQSYTNGNNREITVSEICQKVAKYYNEMNDTNEFVVFEDECTKTEDGYTVVLRSQGGNVANKLVGIIDVNLKTREVKDEWGNVWVL